MTGDILQRINDHARIQSFLTGSSLNILFSMFNILIFGIILALYSGTIFLIFIIGSLVYIIYVWLFLKKRAELDHKRFAQQSANQSSVVQLVTGMQEIKLSACEQQKTLGVGTYTGKTFPSEYQKSCPRPVSGFGSYIHKSDEECNHYRTGSGIGDRRENDTGHDAFRAIHYRATEQPYRPVDYIYQRYAGCAPQCKPVGRDKE